MRNNATQYPRPVLNEYLNDFEGSKFEICNPTFDEKSDSIILHLSYELVCPGMEHFIADGYAKVLVRISCFRTSYRKVFELNAGETTDVVIDKKLVSDCIDLQGIIVAATPYNAYRLDEFNKNYFGEVPFSLRKGDVIANEPGMKIKLTTVLETVSSGVVQIAGDPSIDTLKVKYATVEETDLQYSNYITVLLPQKEYDTYRKLTQKKHLKYGIERFLQSSLILPAIVEAITLIKDEELTAEDEIEEHFVGTIWADSIVAALAKNGVDDITSTQKTAVEMANLILGDVASDAINDLMQKMTEWATIRQEEDIL